ncbi:hypothetical protein MSPP1_001262 [Malassezia sp. CBS 17886]|nr:hypothetical protein MSPP1_001262 [Malassezia sp. CBS 17886]
MAPVVSYADRLRLAAHQREGSSEKGAASKQTAPGVGADAATGRLDTPPHGAAAGASTVPGNAVGPDGDLQTRERPQTAASASPSPSRDAAPPEAPVPVLPPASAPAPAAATAPSCPVDVPAPRKGEMPTSNVWELRRKQRQQQQVVSPPNGAATATVVRASQRQSELPSAPQSAREADDQWLQRIHMLNGGKHAVRFGKSPTQPREATDAPDMTVHAWQLSAPVDGDDEGDTGSIPDASPSSAPRSAVPPSTPKMYGGAGGAPGWVPPWGHAPMSRPFVHPAYAHGAAFPTTNADGSFSPLRASDQANSSVPRPPPMGYVPYGVPPPAFPPLGAEQIGLGDAGSFAHRDPGRVGRGGQTPQGTQSGAGDDAAEKSESVSSDGAAVEGEQATDDKPASVRSGSADVSERTEMAAPGTGAPWGGRDGAPPGSGAPFIGPPGALPGGGIPPPPAMYQMAPMGYPPMYYVHGMSPRRPPPPHGTPTQHGGALYSTPPMGAPMMLPMYSGIGADAQFVPMMPTYPNMGGSVPNAGAPVSLDSPALLQRLLAQVEFYFSDTNLELDFFLRQQMDADGFVPLDMVLGFKRVQRMLKAAADTTSTTATKAEELELLTRALAQSHVLEVRKDKQVVRRKLGWERYVLRGGKAAAERDGAEGGGSIS